MISAHGKQRVGQKSKVKSVSVNLSMCVGWGAEKEQGSHGLLSPAVKMTPTGLHVQKQTDLLVCGSYSASYS